MCSRWSLLFSSHFYRYYYRKGEEQAGGEGEHPVGELVSAWQHVEGEIDEGIDEEQNERVDEIAREAHPMQGGKEAGIVLTTEEEFEGVGLQTGDESHRGGCKAWCVHEDIHCQTQYEGEHHGEHLMRAATHPQHEVGVDERCGHIEEMDATKEQRLQEGEGDYGYK